MNNWNFPDQLQSYNTDPIEVKRYLETQYEPGKIVTVPEYMSTTADPAVATRFMGDSNVIVEVKTKRAIPVGYVSTWDSSEREFVVNKGGKYRVKDILTGVKYESAGRGGGTIEDECVVIQLEEV